MTSVCGPYLTKYNSSVSKCKKNVLISQNYAINSQKKTFGPSWQFYNVVNDNDFLG